MTPDADRVAAALLDEDLLAFYRKQRAPELAEAQNILYVLVAHAVGQFHELRRARASWWSAGRVLLRILAGPASTFALVAGSYAFFHWVAPSWTGWIMLGQMGLNLLLTYLTFKFVLGRGSVFFKSDLDSRKVTGLSLGRLDHGADYRTPYTILGILLGTLAIQSAEIYFIPAHVGLSISPGLTESFLISVNNLLHGLFLDFLDHYGIHLVDAVEHTSWSATVFLSFRIVYDTLVVVFVVMLVRRRRVRKFYDVKSLCAWIDQICRQQPHWWKQCPDEFVFLMLVEEYLGGRYDLVRELTHQFPGLEVSNPVRELFVVRAADAGEGQIVRLFEDKPQ